MLEIRNISKRFGGLVAVDQVSLRVNQGEIFGLIGPNGAGKTTFFNILTGIYKPDGGSILFEGSPIHGLKPYKIAQRGISRTFQNIRLLKEETVLDNIKLGMFTKTRTGLWSAILGLRSAREEEEYVQAESQQVMRLVGLEELQQTAAGGLSYGNQRRVEIARALVAKPKLLLLDEPTAGMNGEEVNEMTELIQKVNQNGTTVVLIEHNVAMVMGLCSRIAVLDHGVKIADDLPEAVISKREVIEAYLGKEEDGEETVYAGG